MSGLEPPTSSLRTRRSPELSYIPTTNVNIAPAAAGVETGRAASANRGGEAGIRTLGTPKGSTVFETAPFNHSGTSPQNPASDLAEREGFEPSVPEGTHDFQSCRFDRSRTSPLLSGGQYSIGTGIYQPNGVNAGGGPGRSRAAAPRSARRGCRRSLRPVAGRDCRPAGERSTPPHRPGDRWLRTRRSPRG
jgi:hypothetical protein